MRSVCVVEEIGVAESISGDKFVPEVELMYLETLWSRKLPKMASRPGNYCVFTGKRVRWIKIWRQVI